jgi:hypothetical protein
MDVIINHNIKKRVSDDIKSNTDNGTNYQSGSKS